MTTISILTTLSLPLAITRFVVPVIVSAINRVFRCGGLTHVSKEVDEACPPAFTYANSSTAVEPEIVLVGAVAPPNHVSPNSVDAAFPSLWRMTMNCFLNPDSLSLCTTAAGCRASAQALRRHDSLNATIASTKPRASCLAHASVAQDKPAAKTFPGQFYPLHGVRT